MCQSVTHFLLKGILEGRKERHIMIKTFEVGIVQATTNSEVSAILYNIVNCETALEKRLQIFTKFNIIFTLINIKYLDIIRIISTFVLSK